MNFDSESSAVTLARLPLSFMLGGAERQYCFDAEAGPVTRRMLGYIGRFADMPMPLGDLISASISSSASPAAGQEAC